MLTEYAVIEGIGIFSQLFTSICAIVLLIEDNCCGFLYRISDQVLIALQTGNIYRAYNSIFLVSNLQYRSKI